MVDDVVDGGSPSDGAASDDQVSVEGVEDIDKLDPAVKEIVEKYQKGFQADYTKKTQALAREREGFAEEKKSAEEWQKWYKDNAEGIENYTNWVNREAEKETDSPTDDSDKFFESEAEEDVVKLDKKMQGQLEDLQANLSSTLRQGYKQIMDMVKIQMADPEADTDKILETATKYKITDMREAYNKHYGERLTQKKIDKAVSDAKKEWEEKEKVNVLSSNMPPGRQVRKVTRG